MEKKCSILIAEPWDFDSPDGENIIRGKIIKIISAESLIFKSDHKLSFKNYTGDLFVLHPRFKDCDFSKFSNDIIKKGLAGINGGIIIEKDIDKLSGYDKNTLDNISIFAFIGNICE
ncbi:MAG: hypothetical protein LBV74_10590 [Tannerella sp.]|jgi:hypothetical protein|nr:hypothetical protein [Tannerella sp.]